MKEEQVILVDEQDNIIGEMAKLEAHQKGILHRAFSVFVINDSGEILLQKRAINKYHSGGLWTNSCCSHPRIKEEIEDAVHRRLKEEMGFDCPVKKIFSLTYKSELDKGLTEHELDHVFIGFFNGEPFVNPEEVSNYKWLSPEDLKKQIEESPQKYTEWLKIIFPQICPHLLKYVKEFKKTS